MNIFRQFFNRSRKFFFAVNGCLRHYLLVFSDREVADTVIQRLSYLIDEFPVIDVRIEINTCIKKLTKIKKIH